MSLEMLKALALDLVCFAVPSSQIELVWKSVQSRLHQFQLRPLMSEANQFTSWARMLGSIRGRPAALKLPIQKATVRWLLAWRPYTLSAHRARLLTAVATIACLRVSEVARLQVCVRPVVSLAGAVAPSGGGTGPGQVRSRRPQSRGGGRPSGRDRR